MPPKIVSDVAARIEPGSQVQCSATGDPPIYIALIRNVTVLMNTTNTASSKFYQEGNYTCVATSKYGTDVKHFVIKGGEKIRYQTKPMQRVAIGEPMNFCARLNRQSSILKSPPEDHAVKSTVHITDFPETCHNCTTSLVH